MDPTSFISKLDLHRGLAPLNKFIARVKFPDALSGFGNVKGAADTAEYFCDTAPMPGKTIATSELRHYGPTRKLGREQTYGDLQLSFIMANSHIVRNAFLEWMDYIIDPVTANIRYQNQYIGTVKVFMFDQMATSTAVNSATVGAEYQQAFPTNVDAVNLGWDQLNQVGKFSVNFQYKKWVPINGAGHNNPNKQRHPADR
jgi:hypothetical protein|tara:strand:- start:42 stop:641 length:600 start_codon:yes stop_codon:yes gene_type:complete